MTNDRFALRFRCHKKKIILSLCGMLVDNHLSYKRII